MYRYDSKIHVLVSHKCQSCCSSFDSVALLNLETYDLVLQGSNIINVKLVLTLLQGQVSHSCHP